MDILIKINNILNNSNNADHHWCVCLLYLYTVLPDTERSCPFLIKINKKESKHTTIRKKRAREKN